MIHKNNFLKLQDMLAMKYPFVDYLLMNDKCGIVLKMVGTENNNWWQLKLLKDINEIIEIKYIISNCLELGIAFGEQIDI